ncbi:MAG: hypothetical protein BWX60_00089 [Candidatus Marinimicrobia bacterium ADurb.Bin030]|nr:MAG: hypothetical protein BWX60_00089 [Candidatus Marinimicrobia bacterium ADurb.Bin030]
MLMTLPEMFGGTNVFWVMETVSFTDPIICPLLTIVPGLTAGSNDHFLLRSRAGALMPR